ncbi:unnamed protein product [Polarella glacialis]|uniref:Uncharacterized protein n=1 Tax=Polarella glacialis TaxID=89957 RepID=A0A813IDV2_POLGL|nr:unnamed protein product [Polarella glacialis]
MSERTSNPSLKHPHKERRNNSHSTNSNNQNARITETGSNHQGAPKCSACCFLVCDVFQPKCVFFLYATFSQTRMTTTVVISGNECLVRDMLVNTWWSSCF